MPQTKSSQRPPQAPIKTFRVGAVRAAVWANEVQQDGRTVVQHQVKITRSYRDRDGNWQEVNTYYAQDLPKLALAAQKAYEFVALKESEAEPDSVPV